MCTVAFKPTDNPLFLDRADRAQPKVTLEEEVLYGETARTTDLTTWVQLRRCKALYPGLFEQNPYGKDP